MAAALPVFAGKPASTAKTPGISAGYKFAEKAFQLPPFLPISPTQICGLSDKNNAQLLRSSERNHFLGERA
jgi:hypothetical protein